MRLDRDALRSKIAKQTRSALRLPRRLAHVARVAAQIAYWTATLQLRAGLRRRQDARLIRNSGLFEPDFYLAQCPDDRDAGKDPVDHYLRVGAARGLAPCPLFDGSAYAARNPGVLAAGENPLAHHIRSRAAAASLVPVRPPTPSWNELPSPGLTLPGGPGPVEAPEVEPPRAEASRVPAGPGDGPGPRVRPERSVLAVGVYLCDVANNAVEIARELDRARRWKVEQRWIALGKSALPEPLVPITAWRQRSRVAKFVLLNRLLAELDAGRYEFVLVCDDDISLPDGFVDRYLELVERYDLALAQPARTHGSYTDNWIVEQLDGLEARRTRFVEIGPLFSMRRDAVRLLTPFDETSAMGWGYDFVWPVAVERSGLRMGIVDATPVAHDMRKTFALYDNRDAAIAMQAYLAGRPHLSPHDAFTILEAYPGERA